MLSTADMRETDFMLPFVKRKTVKTMFIGQCAGIGYDEAGNCSGTL